MCEGGMGGGEERGRKGERTAGRGRGYPYRSGSELEYPMFKHVAGLSRRINCRSSRFKHDVFIRFARRGRLASGQYYEKGEAGVKEGAKDKNKLRSVTNQQLGICC